MAMDVERWIVLHLAMLAGEPADSLDRTRQMASFDVDSFDAVEMAFAIEKEFGVEIDPEFFLTRSDTLAQVIACVRAAMPAADRTLHPDASAAGHTGGATSGDPHAA